MPERLPNDPLRPLAERLRPLVRERLEWWRDQVRAWAADPPRYTNNDYGQAVRSAQADGPADLGILPVPFPREPLSELERVALLAAIHDAVPGAAELVNPWSKAESAADRLAGAPYAVLLGDRVPALREHWSTHGGEVAEWVGELERQEAAEPGESGMARLLTLYTGGVADTRLREAAAALERAATVNEKLEAMDAAVPIPATASAQDLAEALGVSKTAILRSAWWRRKRAGQREEAVESRRERLREKGRHREKPGTE